MADSATVSLPATAVTAPSEDPGVHAERKPFGVATTTPAGITSTNVTVFRSTPPVLLMVMSIVVLPPTPIVDAPKNLTVTGATDCAKLEVAGKIKPARAIKPTCIFRTFKTSSWYNTALSRAH